MTVYAAMLNGEFVDAAAPVLPLQERGFQYGDGLFETMLLNHGKIRLLDDHWQRLADGATRLKLTTPDRPMWQTQLTRLIQGHTQGVVKFMLTRGVSERGYRPLVVSTPTTVWQLSSLPAPRTGPGIPGIKVRWCETRLSRNALLAGIKHCNRLEQIMAQSEWHDDDLAEGLMLDTEGELVCATMSNVFLLIDNVWVTPDLRYAGVAGVMRQALLRLMNSLGMPTEQRAVHPDEVQQADEVFVCNAVRGIQPVIALADRRWPVGINTQRLLQAWSEGR